VQGIQRRAQSGQQIVPGLGKLNFRAEARKQALITPVFQ
jgi:hypothetical protein